MNMSKVCVFIACSIDGFIAGPKDELDWLPGAHGEVEDTFTPFLGRIGALLMGRRTYEVARSFEGPWPYGDTPVLVATRHPLFDTPTSVRAVHGSIEVMVRTAQETAGDKDVYLDGGSLIRSAVDAGLVDEVTVTVVPVVLGAGLPLFAGCTRRHAYRLSTTRSIGGGLVQTTYLPTS
jgi:dihydrofolate reductase